MYDVYFAEKVCGTVEITPKGLYKKVKLCCDIPDQGIFRLYLNRGSEHRDLGICIPVDEKFHINITVPLNVDLDNSVRFYISQHQMYSEGNIYNLVPTLPFPHLEKLNCAKVKKSDKGLRIYICNQSSF